MKDWNGNYRSTFVTLGASNHTGEVREENDFYATEPKAIDLLLDIHKFDTCVWECACGKGHLSEVLERRGHLVKSTDLIYRGYGIGGVDFLSCDVPFNGDIITNPPYKYAQQFAEKALDIIPSGKQVALFLKVTFLEGKSRRKLFEENPPKVIYVSSSRLLCAKNAEFQKMIDGGGSAVAYAWYVWEKGYAGETTLKWFN